MRPTTRLRILEILRKQHTASVGELGRLLGMTGANVRHHLGVLEWNDLIEVVGQRREGRGRPANVYGLSRRVLGDGLDKLSHAILDEVLAGLSEEKRVKVLRLLARRLAGPGEADLPLAKRLTALAARLDDLRYQARWEATPAGPRLILGHCPYAAIIAEHPELCQMDAFLLEERLGLPATQTAKLEHSARGERFCAFLIG